MRNFLTVLKEFEAQENRPLNILEIGCIRSIEPGYNEGDGYSTYHIAKFVQESKYKHKFTSVDINISVCNKFLIEKGLRENVNLLQFNSMVFLKGTKEVFDYIYLDSENDADKILEQFLLCQKICKQGGIIIIDDCVPGSVIQQKGNKLYPYIIENHIRHQLKGVQLTVRNGAFTDYSNEIQGWYDFDNIYSDIVAKTEKGHFVEVGSWLGKSTVSMAVKIANSRKDIRFDSVDMWQPQGEGYPENSNPLTDYLKNIEPVKDYINVIQKPSVEAAKDYADNSLDFVFIDASHKYQDVCDDIAAWLPKVKRGGTLAGHDWSWGEVRKAVIDNLTGIEVSGNSWVMYKPKIYDCFTFFNENDLLEIRLNELKDVVDEFVIVESTETFSGYKKPLNFDKKRFAKFNINYIVVDLPNTDAWGRETFQRNAIMQGLTEANGKDYVIISDVDEIPKANVIKSFCGDAARLSMKQYRWKYNNFETDGWKHAIITRKEIMTSPQVARIKQNADYIYNAGWHFTGIADVEGIILKFNSFSHTEMQAVANKEYVSKMLEENNSNGAREVKLTPVPLDNTFPAYLVKNKKRYNKFII